MQTATAMDGISCSATEGLVIEAVQLGDEIDGTLLDDNMIRGSLIREFLCSVHGPLHWRGVRLRHMHIVGDVDLSYCEWRGALRLLDCLIDGDIDLSYADGYGAIVLNRSRLRGINATNCRLRGSLQFIGGLAKRGFHGTGMTVSGVLNLDRTTLVAPVERSNRTAVGLYRARLDDLYMTRSVLIGGLYGNGLTVTRNIRLSGMRARSRRELGLRVGSETMAGHAVSLAGADVGGAIYLFSKALRTDPPEFVGGLNLTRVTCVTLQTRVEDIGDRPLVLDHLRYQRFDGISPRSWLRVIECLPDLSTQPYRQLAQVCDAHGQFTEARDVRIALQKRIDRESPGPWFNQLRRMLLRFTVAYGYRAGWAVGWLLIVSLLAVAVLVASNGFMVHEPAHGASTRGFGSIGDAAAFTIDSLLPFAHLGDTNAWSADPRDLGDVLALGLFVTLKGLAWAFAALALAATTGLVRRD